MSNPDVYTCSECKVRFERDDRDELVIKSVIFTTFRLAGDSIILRRRAIAHLCKLCLEKDEDYNRPELATSPGMQHTKFGRQQH